MSQPRRLDAFDLPLQPRPRIGGTLARTTAIGLGFIRVTRDVHMLAIERECAPHRFGNRRAHS